MTLIPSITAASHGTTLTTKTTMLTEPVTSSIDEEQEGGRACSYSHDVNDDDDDDDEEAADADDVGDNKTTGGREDIDENGGKCYHVNENHDNNVEQEEEEEKQEEEVEIEEIKKEEKEEEQQLEESRMFQLLMRRKRCARLLRTFPRTFALLLGVVIPLFSLIFISMFFGMWLSRLESPDEVIANDAILAAQMHAQVYSFIMINSSVLLPPTCTELFLRDEHHHEINNEIQNAIIGITGALQMALQTASEPSSQTLNETLLNATVSIRNDELFTYMKQCGESARNISQQFFNSVTNAVNQAAADLTFNWIRCYEGAYDLSYHEAFKPANSEYQPAEQEQFYKETWQSDQQSLFLQYFNESVHLHNMNDTNATIKAFNDSIQEATGGSRCNTNGPSGAWFWFTVMTTVGYGNQSPQTLGGTLMVFSLGFISILAFGAVLASAGYIVSRIFDDAVSRRKLQFLSWPWVACVVWGSAYYSWMALIAFYTKVWKKERLNDDSFTMNDGYWFSYISTTSVGLGDIYLEPEVIVGIDLITFPLLFLTGFTLLSAFLGKFSEALIALLRGKKKGLVESLLDEIDQNYLSTTAATTRTKQQQSDSTYETVVVTPKARW